MGPSRRVLGIAAAALCVWAGHTTAPGFAMSQSWMDQVRNSVRRPKPVVIGDLPPPPTSDGDSPAPEKRRGYSFHFSDDGTFMAGAAVLTAAAVSSPFWLPPALMRDSYDMPGYFAKRPYDDGHRGLIAIEHYRPPWASDLSCRISVEYGDSFQDLHYIGGRMKIDTASRWGADADIRYLEEVLPSGQIDSLWMGDCNLLHRFAQSRRIQMHAGLGINWMTDFDRTDAGLNFTYGGDWFPFNPLVMSSAIDLGHIREALLCRGRVTGGLHYRNMEPFVGYEFLKIGRVDTHWAVIGLRIWF